jgi:hypothetical protein
MSYRNRSNIARGDLMAGESRLGATAAGLLVLTGLLLSGCVSPRGTYPDPNGPRSGTGFLVDPHTGLTLPGQPDSGGGGRG